MKQKGFTLIELLAVIVILAIISLIAVPITLNIIENVRRASFKSSLASMFKAAEIYEAENRFKLIDNEGIQISDLDISNKNNYTGTIIRDIENNDEITLISVGNKEYCASGTEENLVIVHGSCTDNDTTEAVNLLVIPEVGTNEIKVRFKARDYESGIKSYLYCFSEEDSNCTEYIETEEQNVVFSNLKQSSRYKILLKAKNGADIVNTEAKEFIITTQVLKSPICSLDSDEWTRSKTLTCVYPKEEGYNYEYSIDGTSWLDENSEPSLWSEEETRKILRKEFDSEIEVYVRITDGINTQNTSIEISKIDKEKPVIDKVELGSEFVDGKKEINITASDAKSGIYGYYVGDKDTPSKEDFIENSSNTYRVSKDIGTYNIYVMDLAQNISEVRTVTVEMITNFAYTGASQTFNVPISGTYKIELWGAQGGGGGAYGSYTSGDINLNKDDTLYIYVGGHPLTSAGGYNGGGVGYIGGLTGGCEGSYGTGGGCGGGATDIRLVNGNWNDFNSLKSRIMVASGGGGNSHGGGGAPGGGLTGYNGIPSCSNYSYGYGGTQTAGGASGKFNWSNGSAPTNGSFGVGGNGNTDYGGGSGSGYYGGGGSGVFSASCGGGASGSSFISGHDGCDAIALNSTASNIVHTHQSIHYSNYTFNSTLMIDGYGYKWTNTKGSQEKMPNPSGDYYDLGKGHVNNGMAKITLIDY